MKVSLKPWAIKDSQFVAVSAISSSASCLLHFSCFVALLCHICHICPGHGHVSVGCCSKSASFVFLTRWMMNVIEATSDILLRLI